MTLDGGLTPSEISTYYAARLPSLKQRGREWRGPCPIHKGKDDNFSVNAENGSWYCHSVCGRGGSIYDLEMVLTKAAVPGDSRSGLPDRRAGESAAHGIGTGDEWVLIEWQHQSLGQRIEKVESDPGCLKERITSDCRVELRLKNMERRS